MAEVDLWEFIGSALRTRRLSAGMEIKEFSARLGIGADKLLAFERNTREMDHETLNRICAELGVDSMTVFAEYPLSENFPTTTSVIERWSETVC
jgi:transcriptional regulator with XRE-family HTH domain